MLALSWCSSSNFRLMFSIDSWSMSQKPARSWEMGRGCAFGFWYTKIADIHACPHKHTRTKTFCLDAYHTFLLRCCYCDSVFTATESQTGFTNEENILWCKLFLIGMTDFYIDHESHICLYIGVLVLYL